MITYSNDDNNNNASNIIVVMIIIIIVALLAQPLSRAAEAARLGLRLLGGAADLRLDRFVLLNYRTVCYVLFVYIIFRYIIRLNIISYLLFVCYCYS